MELAIHSQTATVARLKFGMDKYVHPTLYGGCNYLYKLGLKPIQVKKFIHNVRPFWTKNALLCGACRCKGLNQGESYIASQWKMNLLITRFLGLVQWRHDECDGVSNHQRLDCLLNRLFRRRSKKRSKLRVTGLCEGNSPVTVEFPAQRASNVENVSI